jgi:polar amino acid transport system substrate-binding protein
LGYGLFFSNVFAAETIRISTEEWPPYTSTDLKYNGIFARIVTESFALENVEVEYGFFPAKRSYNLALGGDWNGSMPWNRTPDRENDFDFSDVIMGGELVFFHHINYEFDWASISDLKGLTIGGLIGSNYREAFQDAEKSGIIVVERVPSDLMNLRKLLKRRIHIYPGNKDVGYHLLNTSFPHKMRKLVTTHPRPLAIDKLTILFSKKVKGNTRLIKLFNRGLKKLKEQGKYGQFIKESRRGDYIIKK